MRHVYQKMSEDFAERGLDLAAIQDMQPWFHGIEGGKITCSLFADMTLMAVTSRSML